MKNGVFFIIFCTCFNASLINARQLAFPGADGAGKYTIGGRGGNVYEVTNLNDSGSGSLREAIEASGPRPVVFRVSGTIALESELRITNPYITIAGQTAPGDGICIKDQTLYVYTDQVIIRYIRFRLGDESGVEDDAVWGRYCKNVIIDHCSASWSIDECLSFYGIDSLTVQWCLISESLFLSNHTEGAHGYGGIWGGKNASFHHNLLAHHSSRNPRFSGGSQLMICENVDFCNNVIYNWGNRSSYGGEYGSINMVANYYKPGPATTEDAKHLICEPYGKDGRWYIEENYVDGAPEITINNWAGGVKIRERDKAIIRVTSPFPCEPIAIQSANDAYISVLEHVGVNYPIRDQVDCRILDEVKTGTATFEGRSYEILLGFQDFSMVRGIVDSQNDVGGWPDLFSKNAPTDSDHDGMPDYWEQENDLDSQDNNDRNIVDTNGYTMLENYINSLLVNTSTKVEEKKSAPQNHFLLKNYPNPFNPNTTISYSVPRPEKVSLRIFNLQGKLVRTLIEGQIQQGYNEVVWDGLNPYDMLLSSGIYFCCLESGNNSQVIKMQLIH